MFKTHTGKLDIKKLTENGEFEGYGSVFDVEDGGGDIMVRGAFRKSLNDKPLTSIKMLWQHDASQPIGVWEELKEDEHGLFAKGKIVKESRVGSEALALMRAGALDGLSIGFRTVKAEFDHDTLVRKLLEVDLWEVSVVTFPMNTHARVDRVKNATPRDVEKTLRDAGFAANYAKAVASHGAVRANELMGKQRDAAAQSTMDDILAQFK